MNTTHIATVSAPTGSATSVLYDSTSQGTDLVRSAYQAAVITAVNSASGTLVAYAKDEAGEWVAFWSEVVPASIASRASKYAIDIAHTHDLKLAWVNGGTTQSTWYVSTTLTQDAASEHEDDSDRETTPYVYSGGVPGAVSTAFTLFSSVDELGANAIQRKGLRSALVSMKCAANGTLRAYRSNDGGTTWSLFRSHIVPASVAQVSDDYLFDITCCRDVKIDWLNGGSSQVSLWNPSVALSRSPVTELALTGGYSAIGYMAAADMEATITGAAIAIGPSGGLRLHVVTTNGAAATGTFTLEVSDDGTTWADEPDSSTSFTNPANTAVDFVAEFTVKKSRARLVYTRSSGGAADTCSVNMRTW